jgi:hypothetical protein
MLLAEDNDVVETLPSNRADQPLCVAVLPGRPRRYRAVPYASSLPTGVQLPPAAALRRGHTRGRRTPPLPRDSRVSQPSQCRISRNRPNIRTRLSAAVRFSVRMFGSGGKKRA